MNRTFWERIARASGPLSNIAVVFSAVLLGGVVISTHLEKQRNSQSKLEIGEKVSIAGSHWNEHSDTYLLAVQSACRSCWASVPFARDFLTRADGKAFALIFPLGDNHKQEAEFVRSIGRDVHHLDADFAAIGIKQTPALLQVDSSGRLVKYWQGVFEGKAAETVIRQILRDNRSH
jgi:hypothetical protein